MSRGKIIRFYKNEVIKINKINFIGSLPGLPRHKWKPILSQSRLSDLDQNPPRKIIKYIDHFYFKMCSSLLIYWLKRSEYLSNLIFGATEVQPWISRRKGQSQ